jgi:ribonuclease R
MEKHVGSEFDGTISGVTSFGLFVELADSKVNGLVHVTQLPNDYYHFDPVRKTLSGERSGSSWRLGDPVRVLVLRASVEDRRIDFRLAPPAAPDSANAKIARTARTAPVLPVVPTPKPKQALKPRGRKPDAVEPQAKRRPKKRR